jgi:hypothetical protein
MHLDPINRSLLRLALYYALLVAGTLVLTRYSAAVREAVSVELPSGSSERELRRALAGGTQPQVGEDALAVSSTGLTVALAMTGALLLMVPVASVYMLSKQRQGWDPSVVQTVILLPLVVAGIAVLVHNSLALAFSLAGLAAAVRFRNTLKDTKDAVYIFLSIAVGLAAGVQALELGFVVSVVFNVAVLSLWALNIGDTYAGEPRPAFTREFAVAVPERPDHSLVVQADGPAQQRVEAALHDYVKSWKLAQRVPGEGGRTAFTYLVRLKKSTTPAALLAAVAAHGGRAELHPRTD